MRHAIIGFSDNGDFREELTETSFDDICRARETCLLAVELEEKINLLIDNYYEWEVDLLKLAEAKRVWPEREHITAMQERLLLDRRIVNLLTACRLYLDHSSHALSHLFGKNSSELAAASKRTHEAYDDIFGYRFMEELRNYVQHRGLLVHSITYWTSLVTQDAKDSLQFTIAPTVELASLEGDGKFKPSILEEAKSLGKTIDLRQTVREYVAAIWSLHMALRTVIDQTFADRFALYRSIVGKYQQHNGAKVHFSKAVVLGEQAQHLREVALVDHLLPYYDMLCRKNQTVANLTGSYASNYCKTI